MDGLACAEQISAHSAPGAVRLGSMMRDRVACGRQRRKRQPLQWPRQPRGLSTQRVDEACVMAETEHHGAQCVSRLTRVVRLGAIKCTYCLVHERLCTL